VMMQLGKLEDSIAAAHRAVDAAPAAKAELRAQALTQLSALELRVGSSRDAIAHAKEAAGLSKDVVTQATYIRAWARTKDPDAIAEAEKLVKAAPTSADAQDALGRALAALERYDEADAAFAKAVSLDAKMFRARLHRAMALVDAGKGTEAVAAADALTKTDKNQPEAWAVLGAALITKDPKNWQAAIDPAQQGVFLAPKSAYAQYWVGRIFDAAKNYGEAGTAYKRAAEADPYAAKARVALVQQHLDDVGKAATEAAALANELPFDPEVQLYCGKVLLKNEDYAGALDPLERSVSLRPKSAEAQILLGDAYRANKQYADAADVYKRAVALAPDNVDYQRLYGFSLAMSGKCAAAAPLLQKAAKAQPTEAPEAYFRLSWCQYEAARKGNSKEGMITALETARRAKGYPKADRVSVMAEVWLGNRRGTPPPPPAGMLDTPCDLAALYKQATDGDEGGRVRAIRKMVCASDDAVKYLASYLGEGNLVIKTAAAKTLAGIGAEAREACPALAAQTAKVQQESILPGPDVQKLSADEQKRLFLRQRDFQQAGQAARDRIGCK
jgi:tetratricopeptide (TPR) repeat protein